MDALIYFSTKRVELFDIRERLATDLLLIGLREAGNLRNGLFERSDRWSNLAHSRSQKSRIWLVRRSRKFGAGEGNRTLVCSLGSCRSAIELRPQTIELVWYSKSATPANHCSCLVFQVRYQIFPCLFPV